MTDEFVRLALLAMLIALPAAGFIMYKWHASYAYHIRLSWWMFIVPVALLLLTTISVICKEIIKTAFVNPIRRLRAE